MGYKLEADEDYYADRPVPHVAQGDLFEDVPCAYAALLADGGEDRGARKRPHGLFRRKDAPKPAAPVCDPDAALVVVCNYTCGFVAQPPGQFGYSHQHRLVAPIIPIEDLLNHGVKRTEARKLRDNGQLSGILRVPPPPGWLPVGGWREEEFAGHMAVCLWRITAVQQSVLDDRNRVARLSESAQRLLIGGLIQVVSPALIDPFDEHLPPPDMSSSWSTTPRQTPG